MPSAATRCSTSRWATAAALRDRYVFGDYSSRTSDSPQGSLFVIGRNLRTEQLVAANRNPFDLALLGNTGVVMKLVRSRWGRDLRSGIVGLGMVPVPASVPASVPA